MGYDVRKFENNMDRFDKDNDGKGDVGLDVIYDDDNDCDDDFDG